MLAPKNKPITIQEFLEIEFDHQYRYELIDGYVMMSPQPTEHHNLICSNIDTVFNMYFMSKRKNCSAITNNALKTEKSYILPDVMVKCFDQSVENTDDIKPLIVIEVLSPNNISNDMFTKLNIYRNLGIPEYWIVDPKSKTITINIFEDQNVQVNKYYFNTSEDTMIQSSAVKGIQIDMAQIFRLIP